MATSTKTWLTPAFGLALMLATPRLGAQTFEVDGSKFTVIDENRVELTKYGGEGGAVTLPAIVSADGNDYSLTRLGASAFLYKFSVKQVVLPESVTEIGEKCFNACGLEAITMTTIGDYAFYFCVSLGNLSLPSSLRSIGNHAFFNCSAFTEVAIPASVTEIGDNAFDRCPRLAAINVSADNKAFASADGVLFDKPFETVVRFPVGKKEPAFAFPETVKAIAPYALDEPTSIFEEVDTAGLRHQGRPSRDRRSRGRRHCPARYVLRPFRPPHRASLARHLHRPHRRRQSPKGSHQMRDIRF